MPSTAARPSNDLVEAILAYETPDLGLTQEEAHWVMDNLFDLRAEWDDDASRAYDLLHARATHGRAW